MNISKLNGLIKKLNEGEILAEDLAVLENELVGNPESMSHYLALVDVENLLEYKSKLEQHIKKPVISMERVLQRQRVKTVKWVALSTAAILMLGIIGLSLFRVATEDTLAYKLGPDTRFTISHSGGGDSVEKGKMQKGSRLKLAYGSVSLNLESGVKAVIQAPADIEMLADDLLKMRSGIGWYEVPAGAEGFTVLTNEMRVVDLGTEFGVVADLNKADEVHVMNGKVRAISLKSVDTVAELKLSQSRKIDKNGQFVEIEPDHDRFIDELPSRAIPQIVFEEEFNTSLSSWRADKGNALVFSGDYSNTKCKINTVGDSDHSTLKFSINGEEIEAVGVSYLALGDEARNPPNVISTKFQVYKGRKQTVYFRHAGSHNGSQKLGAVVRLNGRIIAEHNFDCSDKEWSSSSFSFDSEKDGLVTLTFNNAGSVNSDESDTLLDSILVTSELQDTIRK